ncbi:MAG TPA: hypothetical protein PKC28_03825 [Bdellovibrionales bacterium]|nr:hypothetical protein [Bdellovibrionales bacterium]
MREYLLILFILFVAACAHHKDVRPGADGLHRVALQTDSTEQASRDAISQANHYCKEAAGGKHAAFVDESQKYTGDMDEQTYKNAKRATTVAKTVGGGVFVMGGKRESDLGGIVGLGGAAADQALGKGYTVEMKFKCL